MTPEPTSGFYRTDGVESFIRRFGYADKRGREDRLNFGGVFLAGVRHAGTRLTLTLDGFDPIEGKIRNVDGSLALVADDGVIAAEWSFASLMSLWNRKHARAAYIPAEARTDPRKQYRYGGTVRLGQGTDFEKLLKAIANNTVYYDPGIKMEDASTSAPKTKTRSQFRIKSNRLAALYSTMEDVVIA